MFSCGRWFPRPHVVDVFHFIGGYTRKIIVVLLSDVAIFTEPDSDNLDLAAIFKSGQR